MGKVEKEIRMGEMPQHHHAWPLEHYHEDMGPVLWHRFPIEEAPWCGTPLDSDWPGYHTHFQPLPPVPVPVDPTITLRQAVDELRTLARPAPSDT
jgi:hypothetical protein